MKLIDTLLGFAVLTGPLWLILILLPVSIWIAAKVAKRFKRSGAKLGVGLLVFLSVLFLPFADEIAGRIYLSHLCATEAGVKVYQTVELPTEYWDENRKPKFLNDRGVLVREVLGDRYEWRKVSEPYFSFLIRVEKEHWLLHDKQSNKDLGEKITFSRYFGWINQFSPAPSTGESCRDLYAKKYSRDDFFEREHLYSREFLLRVFIPSQSSL